MMTNRQEVAKKLRENSTVHTTDEVYVVLLSSIGITYDYANLLNRLADLIDPTCRIYYTDTSTDNPWTGYEPDGYYSCSCCGELDDGFAEMWDDYQASDYEGEPPFRYCPSCGARVVRDD